MTCGPPILPTSHNTLAMLSRRVDRVVLSRACLQFPEKVPFFVCRNMTLDLPRVSYLGPQGSGVIWCDHAEARDGLIVSLF